MRFFYERVIGCTSDCTCREDHLDGKAAAVRS